MTEIIIDSFRGKYDFLSNFYPAIVQLEGLSFPTVEHAYQAAKTTEFFFRKLLAALPAEKAGLAKSRGRMIKLRSGWNDIQIDTMHELLCNKFRQEPFKTKLIETGEAKLVEGNRWHDNKWGDCSCNKCKSIEGQNWLGRLLMDIRSQVNERGNCYRRYS